MALLQEKLRRVVKAARRDDPDLDRELAELTQRGEIAKRARGLEAQMRGFTGDADGLAEVAAAARVARPNLNPVFKTANGKPVLTFPDAESMVWKDRLEAAGEFLARAAVAVGCFEVTGRAEDDAGGTGVMVAPDVLATSFHVAHTFALREGDTLKIKSMAFGGRMKPFVDFTDRPLDTDAQDFEIVDVLHLQEDKQPDIALLRVKRVGGTSEDGLPAHLHLADEVTEGRQVAVIGYPKRETHANADDLDRIFDDAFNIKRVAPGKLQSIVSGVVEHDCSVLTGNSGSPLVDLETGKVVAIHFAGNFPDSGFAVDARLVTELLVKLDAKKDAAPGAHNLVADAADRVAAPASSRRTISVTIPIHVTLEIGEAVVNGAGDAPAA